MMPVATAGHLGQLPDAYQSMLVRMDIEQVSPLAVS
jgi:hypothetical protein